MKLYKKEVKKPSDFSVEEGSGEVKRAKLHKKKKKGYEEGFSREGMSDEELEFDTSKHGLVNQYNTYKGTKDPEDKEKTLRKRDEYKRLLNKKR